MSPERCAKAEALKRAAAKRRPTGLDHEIVYTIAAARGHITYSELAKQIGCSFNGLAKAIQRCIREKFVVRVEKTGTGQRGSEYQPGEKLWKTAAWVSPQGYAGSPVRDSQAIPDGIGRVSQPGHPEQSTNGHAGPIHNELEQAVARTAPHRNGLHTRTDPEPRPWTIAHGSEEPWVQRAWGAAHKRDGLTALRAVPDFGKPKEEIQKYTNEWVCAKVIEYISKRRDGFRPSSGDGAYLRGMIRQHYKRR